MTRTALECETNLFDFFHGHVADAARDSGAGLSEEGVLYLSNLLVERGRVDEVPDSGATLVELQLEAAHASRARSISIWREMGDKALYLAGFFRRSLDRRGVGTDYYEHVGASAYGRLSSMLATPRGMVVGGHKGLDEIFGELAGRFDRCTGVLDEVRAALQARVAEGDHSVLLDLYDEWLRTGRKDIARQLRRLGLVLEPESGPGC